VLLQLGFFDRQVALGLLDLGGERLQGGRLALDLLGDLGQGVVDT